MKRVIVAMSIAVSLCLLPGTLRGVGNAVASEPWASSSEAEKFEKYRSTIKAQYGIDIKDFGDTIKGGKADGQKLTKYDLDQLLMGIKVETEHTSDRLIALEIVTDHLEEFPDYYTRLLEMEHEAERDAEREKERKGVR